MHRRHGRVLFAHTPTRKSLEMWMLLVQVEMEWAPNQTSLKLIVGGSLLYHTTLFRVLSVTGQIPVTILTVKSSIVLFYFILFFYWLLRCFQSSLQTKTREDDWIKGGVKNCSNLKYSNSTSNINVFMVITITIILFRSITMFCGTDNIIWNILILCLNYGNIMHNTVSPAEHCYGFKYSYDDDDDTMVFEMGRYTSYYELLYIITRSSPTCGESTLCCNFTPCFAPRWKFQAMTKINNSRGTTINIIYLVEYASPIVYQTWGWTFHTTYVLLWVWEGVLVEALAYITYTSERYYFSLVCTFKKVIKDFEVKVDVQFTSRFHSLLLYDNSPKWLPCSFLLWFAFGF